MTRTLPALRIATTLLIAAGLSSPAAAVTAGSRGPRLTVAADLRTSALGASVDPLLEAQLAAGPALAVFAWDRASTTREDVEAHLSAEGIAGQTFASLPVAVACVRGAQELPALASTPGVTSVWADRELEPASVGPVAGRGSGDRGSSARPGDLPEDATGEGVGIAVLDTGVDATHPDLPYGDKVERNVVVAIAHREVSGAGELCPVPNMYYPPPESPSPMPDLLDTETTSGHGTHLAGVAAGDGTASSGRYAGIAPGADVYGYQVIGSASPSADAELLEVRYRPSLVRATAAVEHLNTYVRIYEPGLRVALLGFSADHGLFEYGTPLHAAMDALSGAGVIPVVPVGNEGPEPSDCGAPETCRFSTLAADSRLDTSFGYHAGPFVIAVGATEGGPASRLADYSSRGDPATYEIRTSWNTITWRYEPTIVAPGTALGPRRIGLDSSPIRGDHNLGAEGSGHTRGTSYQAMTGTSVAAARTAGVVALMQQAAYETQGCYLRMDEVYDLLRQTADPMPGYGSHEVGSGALDAPEAIQAARYFAPLDPGDPDYCPGA